MTQYIVKARNGICRHNNSKPVWNIPHLYCAYTSEIADTLDGEEKTWPTTKPNKGVSDINAAYRRAQYLTDGHRHCKMCIFEVEEVQCFM